MTAPLEANALMHDYGNGPALELPRLEMDPGRVHLAGPNGSGKTTLLRILATLMEPTRGDARIMGTSIRHDPRHARARIGYAAHRPLLHASLPTHLALTHHARLHGLDPEHAHATLQAWDLDHEATTRVRALSHGQRRRLDLARALMHDPRVVLLDEPTAGLDEAARQHLDRQLEASKPQLVLLAAPGDPGVPTDRTLRLEDGRLATEAPA